MVCSEDKSTKFFVFEPVPPFTTCTIPDKVDAAAAIVIFSLPSKAIPLMFLGVANFVAVPALPEIFIWSPVLVPVMTASFVFSAVV